MLRSVLCHFERISRNLCLSWNALDLHPSSCYKVQANLFFSTNDGPNGCILNGNFQTYKLTTINYCVSMLNNIRNNFEERGQGFDMREIMG